MATKIFEDVSNEEIISNMKIVALLLMLLTLTILSCKEDVMAKPDNKSHDPNLLYGYWAWKSSAGGLSGEIITPENTGHTLYLSLLETGMAITYENEKPKDTLRFELVAGKSIYTDSVRTLIRYSDGRKQSFLLEECSSEIPNPHSTVRCETLILMEECYDCYRHTFVNAGFYPD